MNTNRRNFFKKGCSALCACGFSSLVFPSSVKGETENAEDPMMLMMRKWIFQILESIETIEDDEIQRSIIKNGSKSHYEQLNMDEMLIPYIGDIDKFLQFIANEWNWKVSYQKEQGIIIADENKDFCVCPLINQQKSDKSSALCYCSEGFAELMFSKVVGKKVVAQVVSSIQRGDDSCKYEIRIS